MRRSQRGKRCLLRRTEGLASIEFAIVVSALLLIIGGIIDLGHAWYMNQIIINASREGARYGITYKTNTIGTRLAPSALTPTIQNYILNTYLPTTILPLNANPTVNVGGSGYSTGAKGNPVEVTVTAIKTWYLLSMVPSMGYSKNLTATTVMLCE